MTFPAAFSARGADRQTLADALEDARARTLLLITPLNDAELRRQHDALMSPIVWDLGHIAYFEELWLTRNLDGPIEFVEMPGLYNPNEHPRRERGELDLPGLEACRELMENIRVRVLTRLGRVDFDTDSPLLQDGYVYHMVLQHEYQHNETMLQTLQLKQGMPYTPAVRWPIPAAHTVSRGDMLRFPGGEVELGTDDLAEAYDNERPRHRVVLRPFRIDVHPVTNGEHLEFMSAGGYQQRGFWSDQGWRWLEETGALAPLYWARGGDGWTTRTMDREGPVDASHPVCHVCFHEAEAYARFAGKRLPTEAEWETAASWDGTTGTKRRYPWGDAPPTRDLANVDQLTFGTAPVGSYPGNLSALGCSGLIGDVWEWTSSDFRGYPGFESFPYPEYSQDFFGTEYKVLRGGSWATRPGAIRNTFRNWDYPIRRQLYCGFRCASDE